MDKKSSKKSERNITFHILDSEIYTIDHDDIKVLLWSNFSDNKNVISLPKYAETNSIRLRNRYLAWIYELGEKVINGKTLVDHFEIRPGLSFWWMTLLSEKSIFKSPQIFDVIKLFAIEDLQEEIKPNKIILTTGNKILAEILNSWCSSKNIKFELRFNYITENENISFLRRKYKSLPHPLLALVGLCRHVFKRLPFPQYSSNIETHNGDVTIIDYLINLPVNSTKTGKFSSNYWSNLVDVLRNLKIKTKWFHIFIPHEEIRTPQCANDLLDRFNKSSNGDEHHRILNGIISFSMLNRIIKDYFQLLFASIRTNDIKRYFRPSNSSLDLWALYKEEWNQGTRGTIAISSLINFNLLENIFKNIQTQKLGIYLLENQNWEIGLIYAWKNSGHNLLIGVPHSTVRFWDFRYFHDPRVYLKKGANPLPMPDNVAINGPVAKKEYIFGNYPPEQLLEVEALRYFHLNNLVKKKTNNEPSINFKILVCGDIGADASHKMMHLLEEVYKDLPVGTYVAVKSHPAYDIRPESYPELPIEITREPLGDILQNYDVAYVSYITSAAVDAYCSGLPVIQLLDGEAFNMSALRGLDGVNYVTNASELKIAFNQICNNPSFNNKSSDETFFYLNDDMKLWHEILSKAL